MKSFFTLAALFISVVSFAAAPPRAGRLIISNADNSISHVRVNGRLYNLDQQTIIFNNLAAGRQFLEVYRTERPRYGFGRGNLVLVQTTPVYVDPSFIVDVNINRTGRITIGKTLKVRNGNIRYYDARDGRYYEDDRFGGRDDRFGYRDDRFGAHDDVRYDSQNDNSYNDRDDRNSARNDNKYNDQDDRYSDRDNNRGSVKAPSKNDVREDRPEVLPVPVPGNGGRPVRKVM